MKKILVVVLALALTFGIFAGCSLVEEDDGNVVIATVNGKPILKSEFDEIYKENRELIFALAKELT